MENLLEQLQQEKRELIASVTSNGSNVNIEDVLKLKKAMEELELAAASAKIDTNAAQTADRVTTIEFYCQYLVVVMLCGNLNDARFLWKRLPAEFKTNEELSNVWGIGKALWQRNYADAYDCMNQHFSDTVQPLIHLLHQSTRDSIATLLSNSYSSIPLPDAKHALGFTQDQDLVTYCKSTLQWRVADNMVYPIAISSTSTTRPVDLRQLENMAAAVLQLEQQTVLQLN